ncbi:aconitase X catalytic domain-containing protein [Thermococcus waiotapuensis]|uniref:Phosphomevalonate dehydratase large subunit n=1 Tax=Thermococcus waiotapuensis TaxID=90909 RepID=A0AAE4T371_9EURY|nr:aconitase X catalytic domain-containing protein [Thermococcus waiotapuensis]MDV3104767.1 aconitase X catalytic domain-containing protein [Thermococcus waiotapuensis]
MYLTKEEELVLAGEYGYALQKAMEILVALGDIYGADRLIPIKSAQIAGVSYKNLGEAGLEFLRDFVNAGARVSVYTTLNPAGIGDEEFMEKQREVLELYRKMKVEVTSTCTPYYGANLPKFGDNLAWSESSAVIFANSVIGARTNREGGPSSLAAAIVGKTPNYGLHLEENRKATVIVDVQAKVKTSVDYAALGYHLGRALGNDVPYLRGIKPKNAEFLKGMGAAMAASGSIALYHVDGETPEHKDAIADKLETITVEEGEVKAVREQFRDDWSDIDMILIGCPHASLQEVKEIAELLAMRGRPLKVPLFITASRAVKALADALGYTEVIERYNGRIMADSCFVVSPVKGWYRGIATNSGKSAFYFRSFGFNVRLDDAENLIKEAP